MVIVKNTKKEIDRIGKKLKMVILIVKTMKKFQIIEVNMLKLLPNLYCL